MVASWCWGTATASSSARWACSSTRRARGILRTLQQLAEISYERLYQLFEGTLSNDA